jgi:serine/threonine protein kinase
MLKTLDHEHLVRVVGSYHDMHYLAGIMVPVVDMFLLQYLLTCSPLEFNAEKQFRTYYGCLASAIAYLHEKGFHGRLVRHKNILLKDGKIFVTGFGAAINSNAKDDSEASYSKGGPRVERGPKGGTRSDIWCLGILFLQLTTVLHREHLFAMRLFLEQNGSSGSHSGNVFANKEGAIMWTEQLYNRWKGEEIDNAPIQWIGDMLQQDPLTRPSASQIFQDIKKSSQFCCESCKGLEKSID